MPPTGLSEKIKEGRRIRAENFLPEISFYYPGRQTLPVSLTGERCELNCARCRGHYLLKMAKPWQMEILSGKRSFLISGGFDREGRLAVSENEGFLRKLAAAGRLNFHTGFPSPEDIRIYKELAYCVSLELFGDDETIAETGGLNRTADDYFQVYRQLKAAQIKVIPHICIGARQGRISGEERILHRLTSDVPEEIIFLVFRPAPSGAFPAHCLPPPVEDVIFVLWRARKLFPDIPIKLGCIRPGGMYRMKLDDLAVRAGINGLVLPSPGAKRAALECGLSIKNYEECCAL